MLVRSVFHPSRRPSQYGRRQTLASRPYASRALANYAFALDGASRQASRLEPFLEDARSLFLDLPTSLQNRALRQSFFKNQIKNAMVRVHLTWSLQRSPVKSRLSRVPWLRTPRAPSTGASYTGALLAALSVGSSAGCTRLTALALLWCFFSGPVIFFSCSRQVRVQTDQYCNPIPGLPLWALALGTRSLLSCGRWFLTSHWRYPQSALGRWSLWLLRPIGAQTQAYPCRVVLRPKLCSPSQTQVISKFPNFQNTTSLYRCPHSLQKPSIRSTSVMESL